MSETDHPRPDGLSVEAAVAELRQHLLADGNLTETLNRVTSLSRRAVPEASEVSITLVEGERARTAAFTGSIAVELDKRQYESGFGPCLGAATSGQTIRTRADDPESPYPEFARACRRAGMQHTLSVALPVAGRVVGAMNLYSAGDRPFGDEAESTVGTFAGYAAVTLAKVALYADAVDLAGQLKLAMAGRAVIEQAKGILMAQNGWTEDEAFTALARLSQTRNVKLRVLAQDLVHRASARGRRTSP